MRTFCLVTELVTRYDNNDIDRWFILIEGNLTGLLDLNLTLGKNRIA